MTNTADTDSLPKAAYVLLWFPKPSETFIFRECSDLAKMGLPVSVYTLYDKLTRDLSAEMDDTAIKVTRLGMRSTLLLFRDLMYWLSRNPREAWKLMAEVPFRRWPSLEMTGENLWAFLCGFTLARRFLADGIQHIHSPWACGPGTAAWVASRLSGIPFSFTGRAHDIYPPDGAIREKIRDATFVRVNTQVNVEYMRSLSDGNEEKVHLIYNGMSLQAQGEAPVAMVAPFRFVALGRLVPTKGYEYLLRACGILNGSGVQFRLIIGGTGSQLGRLKRLARQMGISDWVAFPGHVLHDDVPKMLAGADVFIMPSVVARSGSRDGIPNVIIEALVHRVPVVASRVSGIGEIVVDGVTGRLVPEKDARALARAIQDMTGDRATALKMASCGRDRAMEMFDSAVNHHQVLGLIRTHSLPAEGRKQSQQLA